LFSASYNKEHILPIIDINYHLCYKFFKDWQWKNKKIKDVRKSEIDQADILLIKEVNMVRRFKVVIEKEHKGGYSVHAPALPGCASQGETEEEALSNITEAIQLYLWSLKDDNLPIPESDVNVILKEVEVSI